MRQIQFAFVTLVILAFAACSGTQTVYVSPTVAPSSGTSSSTVSFLVIVPAPVVATRTRPNVVVPSNATSVTFTVDSVNGSTYTGTPVTETLAASNSACTSVNGQLSCAFNLSAPVGTLIYTVTVYNGTSVIAEGNVSVTTTSGSIVSAPVTLTGTVAKIVVSVGTAVAGLNQTVSVTVQAEDSKGNTILGTYTSAITLTDTDSSGQTSVATSGTDNPPTGELLSSGDMATLTYKGGAMSSAATIGASASGVSPTNVTGATFSPTVNYYTQSGSVTFGTTQTYGNGYDGTPTPNPSPTVTVLPSVTIATGQAFGSVTDAIGITGLPSAPNSYLSSAATTYYDWSTQGSTAVLGLVGWSDPDNLFYQDVTEIGCCGSTEASLVSTCTAPFPQLLVLPMPASWNVYSGSGPCTTVYTDIGGDLDTYTYNANGSYSDTFSGTGAYDPPGSATINVDSAGNLAYSLTSCCGSGTMTVPAPSPGASLIPVTFTAPVSGSAFFPTPAPTTAPNPWLAIGLPNGVPPNPLFSDTFTNVGAINALPAGCVVMPGLVPATNPPLSEADETIAIADPMDNWLPFYTSEKIKHYYLNGVGEVCNETYFLQYYFDGYSFGNSEFWAFNGEAGAAVEWYSGLDTNWDSYYSDNYTYITATTLTSVQSRVRDFTKVLPAATQALTATTYVMAHARLMQPRRTLRHQMRSQFWKTP